MNTLILAFTVLSRFSDRNQDYPINYQLQSYFYLAIILGGLYWYFTKDERAAKKENSIRDAKQEEEREVYIRRVQEHVKRIEELEKYYHYKKEPVDLTDISHNESARLFNEMRSIQAAEARQSNSDKFVDGYIN